MKPICSFKIYPNKRGLFYKVNVWKTQKELIKHATWVKLRPPCQGLCSTFWTYRKNKLLPMCGEINLISKHCGSEAVAHELCHAVLGWCRRKNILLYDDDRNAGLLDIDSEEEKCCYAYGRMFSQMNHKLYKHKIWK